VPRSTTGRILILCALLSALPVLSSASSAAPPPTQPAAECSLRRIKVLDLETAQSIALAHNPDINAARMRIDQARSRIRQAVAAWHPRIDLTTSGVRQRLSDTSYRDFKHIATLLGKSAEQTGEEYSAGLEATWTLFDGFYRSFNEQRSRYEEQTAQAALRNSHRLLAGAVAEAFLNAQLAQANADIARANQTFYIQELHDAQNRFDVGAGPWNDILNIKVQINAAATEFIRAHREYEAASYGLAALMGLPAATLPEQVRLQTLDQLPDSAIRVQENTDELLAEAARQRPDLQALKTQVRLREASVGMAKAPLYPAVRVAGSIEGNRENDPGIRDEHISRTVGMEMRWNLYAGGADRARIIEAEQARREAGYLLAGQQNEVAAEVRGHLARLAAAEEQVRLQRETVQLVEENRDLAKNAYAAGEDSLVRLNEAQRDLVATHARLAQALASRRLQHQRLLAAIGRNLPPGTPEEQP
jgi:outer membrane protein